MVRGLVEEQQVGVAGERPGERGARQLAAGEGRKPPIELLVGEAEAVERPDCPRAPVPATRVLQAGLGARVAVEERAFVGPLGHLELDAAEVLLERDQVAAAGEDVVAQAEISLARRALVVQRGARALLEGELAAVDAGLAGDHSQERGLPGAVAARERHAVAALELERDVTEQRGARHVLVEGACDHHGHVRVKAKGRAPKFRARIRGIPNVFARATMECCAP